MKLKSAVKIAALKAVFTQLKTTTKPSISVTAGVFQAKKLSFQVQTLNRILADAQAKKLSFQVQTLNRILADAQEGNFIYFAKYFDTFYVKDGARPSDEMVFELFRYLADDSDVADLYIAEFNKIVGDSVGISDTEEFTKDFHRPLVDAPAVDEAYAASFQKPRADGFSAADDAAKLHPNKGSFETTYFSDDIDTFDLGKATTDATAVADTLNTIGLQKPQEDSAAAVDVNTTATTKQFTDDVSFTDDVDGEASILDDQETQFVKQRTDTAFIGDSIYIQRVYTRDFFHAAATADDALFTIGKPLSDTSGTSDSTNMVTGKHIYDIPVAAETLAFALNSARADSALFGDVNEVAFNKTLLELTSTADAGSLRSHNYSDFTYFGEDFVGASRTF